MTLSLESGEQGIALSLESGQKGASLSLESGQMGVSLSLDSLEKKVEDRLQQKVTFLLERLDTAVQVRQQAERAVPVPALSLSCMIAERESEYDGAGNGPEPGEPGDRHEQLPARDGRRP